MAKAVFYPVFQQKLSVALKRTAEDMDAAFSAVIESSIFPWPRITIRRFRSPAGSPRDIVDSGDFLRSQSFSFPNTLLARFVWDIEYAVIILYGASLRNGGRIEARDWIGETLRQIDVERVFADAARRAFA